MLKLGTARADISPPTGIYLTGYADRSGGCSSIRDILTATATVWIDGDGNRSAIVFLDILGINRDVYDRIYRQLSRKIKLNGLYLSCAHTHSGPVGWAPEQLKLPIIVKDMLHRLIALPAGLKQPSGIIANKRYIDSLIEAVIGTVLDADSKAEEVELFTERVPLDLGINRREKTADGVIIGQNPDGPVAEEAALVQARNTGGDALLTLVNYDCHPVFFGPQSYAVSADWVGEMRRLVEEEVSGFCVYMQGGSGNINPRGMIHQSEIDGLDISPAAQEASLMEAGRTAADAVIAGLKQLQTLPVGDRDDGNVEVSDKVFACELRVDVPLLTEPAGRIKKFCRSSYRSALSKMTGMPKWIVDPVLNLRYPWRTEIKLETGGALSTPVYCGYASIGGVSMASLSMETFFETAESVRAMLPGTALFAGCTNGLTGYLPTRRAAEEGGYEVETSPYMYRLPGQLDENAETMIINAFESIIKIRQTSADETEVRKLQASDEAEVVNVCHKTFFGGPDFPYPELIGYRWAVWYVRNSPDYSFVAVDETDRAVGYILCARDTAGFQESYRKEMLPFIREYAGRLKDTHPALFRRFKMDFLPPVDEYSLPGIRRILSDYPAHLHIDLLPEYQKKGIGGRLMRSLLEKLKSERIKGVHLIVGSSNDNAVGYYSHLGFRILASGKLGSSGFHVMGLLLKEFKYD